MTTVVTVPQVSVNEEFVTLVEWSKPAGSAVRRGETICVVETTKSVVEIAADGDGYLQPLVEVGDQVTIQQPLAVLTDTADEDIAGITTPQASKSAPPDRQWTRKAAIVAKKLGVDLEALAAATPDRTISELDVRSAAEQSDAARDLVDDVHTVNRAERIILLGGAAGGGIIALDALARIPDQRAVGILDNNPKTHGRMVMGVPVLGGSELAEQLWADGACDGFINSFIDPIEDRRRNFERLTSKGIRFANIIDPTSVVLSNVQIGRGNLILGNSYIGACTTIGDNNFMASHTCLEHHNRIGSHCTFGPRNTTSGGITVGDEVKTGVGVCFESYVKIGERSILASGSFITNDIPPNSMVKAIVSHTVRERNIS